jgi:peptide/nickel transport system substrate-binding protein
VEWDLSQEKPSGLVPGLATEWHIDPQNTSRWIFTLRPGVKFHDGTEVNADAIVWNVDKVLNKAAPQPRADRQHPVAHADPHRRGEN